MILTAIVASAVWYFRAGLSDLDRAAEVRAVPRVNNEGMAGGSKYIWHDVKILKVFKNESEYEFADRIFIAALSWGLEFRAECQRFI